MAKAQLPEIILSKKSVKKTDVTETFQQITYYYIMMELQNFSKELASTNDKHACISATVD